MFFNRLLQIASISGSCYTSSFFSYSNRKSFLQMLLGCALLITFSVNSTAQEYGPAPRITTDHAHLIGYSSASMADRFKAVKDVFQTGTTPTDSRYGIALLQLWKDLLEQDVTTKEGKTYAFRDGHIPKNVHVLLDYLAEFANEGMHDSTPPQKRSEFEIKHNSWYRAEAPQSFNRFSNIKPYPGRDNVSTSNHSNNAKSEGGPIVEDAVPSPGSIQYIPTPVEKPQEKPLFFVFYTKELDPKIHGHDPDFKVKEKQLRLSAIKAMSRSTYAACYDLDQQFLSGLATQTDPDYLEAFTTALINMQKQQLARDVLGKRLAQLQNQPELREIVNKNLKALGGSTAELPDLLAPSSNTPKAKVKPQGNEPIVPAPGILPAPEQSQLLLPERTAPSTSTTVQPAANLEEQIARLEELIRFKLESAQKARSSANEVRQQASHAQSLNQVVNATTLQGTAQQFEQDAKDYTAEANQLRQEILELRRNVQK